MTKHVNDLILLGVFIYMVAMLLVGFLASRRVHNMTDFLVAGRRLPFYLATATLFATWFGAGPCMGTAGMAFKKGLLGVISDPFAAGVSLILAGLFYVALLRRMKLLTITDIFGKRYSKGTEIFASILMVPVYIGWLGSQMVAMGYVLNVITGIDPVVGIVLGALIVLIYTYAGGMWAVTLTDFIQVTILVTGLFLILPTVLIHVGGFNKIIQATPKEFWHFFPQKAGYGDWISYLGQWMLMGLGCIVGQDLIQRSLASKNEQVAKTSAVTAGIAYILVALIPILLGFAGRIIMPEIADPEFIVPMLAIKFLPTFFLV
ncbi:MAG: sodium:solute symporter family protein, partial [Candidatus Margulisbacteria bacterium]|nr:sodium:solute symporter family protein [Candidatus Margulisiibacteriota bacterium]